MLFLLLLSLIFASHPDSLVIEPEIRSIASGLSRATAIDVTPSGEIFVVERGRNRIMMLNIDGVRKDSLGTRGTGDYRFDSPQDVDVTNGMRIYVADSRNQSVKMYDRRLLFLGMLTPSRGAAGGFTRFQPEMVTVNIMGEAFVYDADSRSIIRFNEQGTVSATIDLRMYDIEFPVKHIRVRDEVLYVIDNRGNVLHQLTSGGNYLGFTMMPHTVNRIAVTESAVWAVGTDMILQMNLRGNVQQKIRNKTNQSPTGLAIKPGYILILTESNVYRLRY